MGNDVDADQTGEPESVESNEPAAAASERQPKAGPPPVPKTPSGPMKVAEALHLVPGALVEQPHAGEELRKYVRIHTIVPVYFQMVSKTRGPIDAEVRTAWTRDISMTGLCLHIRDLPKPLANMVIKDSLDDLILSMDIAMPHHILRVKGQPVWRSPEGDAGGIVVGVQFAEVEDDDARKIIKYAKASRRKPIIIRTLIASSILAALGALGIFVLSEMSAEKAITSVNIELEDAVLRYERVASKLEAQTKSLEELAIQTKAAVAFDDDLDDVEGFDDDIVEGLGADISNLTDSMSTMKQTISDLKEKLTAIEAAKAKKGKGKKKKGKKK